MFKKIITMIIIFCSSNLYIVAQTKPASLTPIDSLFNKAVEISNTDEFLLAILYLNKGFEEEYYNYFSAVRPLFEKYKYKKSSSEFEKRKILPLIKKEFESRQNELNKLDYFVITYTSSLGAYNFENNSFPINEYYYPPNTIIYASNMIYTIMNWNDGFVHDFQLGKDESVFPNYIPMEEKKAELFTRNNKGRKVIIKILVKNLRAAKDDYRTSSHIRIKTYAVATKIYDSNKLLTSFPTNEAVNNELMRMCNKINHIKESWEKDQYYWIREETVTSSLSFCIDRINNILEFSKKYRIEIQKQIQAKIDTVLISNAEIFKIFISRISKLPIYDNKEYILQIDSVDMSSRYFKASIIPKSGNSDFTLFKKAFTVLNGSVAYDDLSPFIVNEDSKIKLRLKKDNSLLSYGSIGNLLFLDIFPSMDEEVKTDKLPEIIKHEQPIYSQEMIQLRTSGRVFVKVLIDTKGIPVKAVIMKSANKILEKPSLEAAMKYKFNPAFINNKPIAVWVVLPFVYEFK